MSALSLRASHPEIKSLPTGRTSCSRAAAWIRTLRTARLPIATRALREPQDNEPVSPLYSPASCDHATDDRDPARWVGGLHPAPGFGFTRGGLSDHPGGDVLSRCG